MESAALTAAAGAYVLCIALGRPLDLSGRSFGAARLPAGHFVYCGSAYGPGGLGARLRRHLRANKARHWHVDQLTAAGRVLALGLAPGGRECALVDAIAGLPVAEAPLAGFGSSDCRRCPAHLLRVPRPAGFRSLAEALGLIWVEVEESEAGPRLRVTSEGGRFPTG